MISFKLTTPTRQPGARSVGAVRPAHADMCGWDSDERDPWEAAEVHNGSVEIARRKNRRVG